MLSLVIQSSFFAQIFSFSHPLHLSFFFRLWRSWKLHEKYRCGFAFSLTVSLFGGHIVCVTCLHTSLVFFQEHTSGKALVWHHLRFPPIRLPKAEGEDRPLGGAKVKGVDSSYIRHTPPTGCGLLLSSLLQPDWCMTNSLTLLHTRESIQPTFKHTPRLLPDIPGPPHSHPGVFQRSRSSADMDHGKLWKWSIFSPHA